MRDFINKFRRFSEDFLILIMAFSANSFSNGYTFLSSLSVEMPNSIKLQEQLVRLGEEKMRLGRQVDKQKQQLLRYSAIYKASKFRMTQLDDQIRTIRIQLETSDGKSSDARMDLQ